MSVDETNSVDINENYNLLKTDAEALLRLVNKHVKVQLIKDTEFVGFVQSIDPVHHSVILLIPKEDSYIVNIIPGHAILHLVETDSTSHYEPPVQRIAKQSSHDIDKAKKKLISWFKVNLLPVTVSGQKIMCGNVSILPPYSVSNICTDNPVVATQLRKIIENMPNDFECDK